MDVKKRLTKKKIALFFLLVFCIFSFGYYVYYVREKNISKREMTPFIQFLRSNQPQQSLEGIQDVTNLFKESYPNNAFVSVEFINHFERYGFIYDKKYSTEDELIFRRVTGRGFCTQSITVYLFVKLRRIDQVKISADHYCL